MITENKKNVSREEIEKELGNFHSTTCYHRFSFLFRNLVLTDGAKYVADKCGAYWLFNMIASYQFNPRVKNNPHLKDSIQFWTLNVKDEQGIVVCEWDKEQVVLEQKIEYTDFPLPQIRIWVSKTQLADGSIVWVAYLPSEH
ncbi:hypothetical protein IQ278_12120 [Tolypothrix sp. LEGE 11397]|uniref:DUF6876 family protein n=1 Tax=Tolypothrix sp. LEGE 11397 TaxID=2777971 RepID=UPI00187E2BDE|nr:DUF6876 family protein [Tolypothrix sp. LEGE 11397]MBE9082860.1 hypothetical protein [Tolypothrix sp. LEGE 11397]